LIIKPAGRLKILRLLKIPQALLSFLSHDAGDGPRIVALVFKRFLDLPNIFVASRAAFQCAMSARIGYAGAAAFQRTVYRIGRLKKLRW